MKQPTNTHSNKLFTTAIAVLLLIFVFNGTSFAEEQSRLVNTENSSAKTEGVFIQQYSTASGGAIYNNGENAKLGDVNANFEGNYVTDSKSNQYGGAIYNNKGEISNISGTFNGNYAETNKSGTTAKGGAVTNTGSIQTIKADFNNNYNASYKETYGGALYNKGAIDSIEGDFTGNYSYAKAGSAIGGAVDNVQGTIKTINSIFHSNYAYSIAGTALSGALVNSEATIEEITGKFISNYVASATTHAGAGALYNCDAGHIVLINADFEGNYAIGHKNKDTYIGAMGGAIINYGENSVIDKIEGDFINNYADNVTGVSSAAGGAIYNRESAEIKVIEGNFEGNYTRADGRSQGGAIYNDVNGKIGEIKGDFTNNGVIAVTEGSSGGAIYNTRDSEIGTITGNFTGNYAISTDYYAEAGAVSNGSMVGIQRINGNFDGNYAYSKNNFAQGGAFGNFIRVGTAEIPTFGVISGSFTNNYAKTDSENHLAFGGAILTRTSMGLEADGVTNTFSGNYTQDNVRGKLENAIFVRTNILPDEQEEMIVPPTLTLDAKNNGEFVFDDTIDGGEINDDWTGVTRNNQYNLVIKGDKTGKVNINNEILNANIEHNDVTTVVRDYTQLNHAEGEGINSLNMKSGTMELGEMSLTPLHFQNFAMNGGTINIDKVEVDLANKKMSRITANTYDNSNGTGTVNVKSMHLTSDGVKLVTPVEFADKSFRDTVKSPVKTAYGPVYKYSVKYEQGNQISDLEDGNKLNENDENGYFVFRRSVGGGKPKLNPAVLSQVANVNTGNQAVINETFEYVFEHLDAFTQFPRAQREALIASQEQGVGSTFNSNLGNIDLAMDRKAAWVRPFASFEKINLNHGPKVNMITYGTLVGYDSDFHRHKNGWVGVSTVYFGYNGAQIDYKGADTSMNGGLVGATQTFYKKNFWTAFTVSVGANTGESHTNFGSEHFTTLLGGIANKTGYNFEFKEGKYIIQPIMYTSYTFAKTFDYTSSTGAKINSGLGSYIELHPSVRFVANLKKGWQLYAAAGVVWMPLHEGTARANGVELPNASIKPYAEYGVGVQRHWNDKFVAFGQAMVRNGGRNGVALTFGFRWKLGKEQI